MPAPTDPITTPIEDRDPAVPSIDVPALVKEVNDDLIPAFNAKVQAQAAYDAAYQAYHDITVSTDDEYNALLLSQETARTKLMTEQEDARQAAFEANADKVAAALVAMHAADATKQASDSLFSNELTYLVKFIGGDPAAIDPTPAPVAPPVVPVPTPPAA